MEPSLTEPIPNMPGGFLPKLRAFAWPFWKKDDTCQYYNEVGKRMTQYVKVATYEDVLNELFDIFYILDKRHSNAELDIGCFDVLTNFLNYEKNNNKSRLAKEVCRNQFLRDASTGKEYCASTNFVRRTQNLLALAESVKNQEKEEIDKDDTDANGVISKQLLKKLIGQASGKENCLKIVNEYGFTLGSCIFYQYLTNGSTSLIPDDIEVLSLWFELMKALSLYLKGKELVQLFAKNHGACMLYSLIVWQKFVKKLSADYSTIKRKNCLKPKISLN